MALITYRDLKNAITLMSTMQQDQPIRVWDTIFDEESDGVALCPAGEIPAWMKCLSANEEPRGKVLLLIGLGHPPYGDTDRTPRVPKPEALKPVTNQILTEKTENKQITAYSGSPYTAHTPYSGGAKKEFSEVEFKPLMQGNKVFNSEGELDQNTPIELDTSDPGFDTEPSIP